MRLYHGSIMTVRKPVVSRGRAKTDFDKGFYTTTSREQAEKWARIKKNREGHKETRAIAQLRTHRLFDQLSFHSPKACALLTFIESVEV